MCSHCSSLTRARPQIVERTLRPRSPETSSSKTRIVVDEENGAVAGLLEGDELVRARRHAVQRVDGHGTTAAPSFAQPVLDRSGRLTDDENVEWRRLRPLCPTSERGPASAVGSVLPRTALRRERCGSSRRPMTARCSARARTGLRRGPRSGSSSRGRGSPARPRRAPGERLVPYLEASSSRDRPTVEGGDEERGGHGDPDPIGDAPHRGLGVAHEGLVQDDDDAFGVSLVRLEGDRGRATPQPQRTLDARRWRRGVPGTTRTSRRDSDGGDERPVRIVVEESLDLGEVSGSAAERSR